MAYLTEKLTGNTPKKINDLEDMEANANKIQVQRVLKLSYRVHCSNTHVWVVEWAVHGKMNMKDCGLYFSQLSCSCFWIGEN
jgi:hypothetical protein